MPGTGEQYNAQFAGLPLASSNLGIGTAATLPNQAQYTNTTQPSSFGVTPEQYLGYIGSTVGGLANFLITPPGYTPGGAPSAGGQFPYNYPITQTDINRIISGNEPRALAKHAEPIQPALLLPTTSTTATPNGPVYSFTTAPQPQSVPPLSLEQLGNQSISAQAISPDTIMLPQTAWQYNLPYIGQLPKVSDSKTFADLLLSQPQSAAAPIYGTTTAAGSIPIGLSMPATAGLSTVQPSSQQFAGLYTQNPITTNSILSNPQPTSTTNNTNTFLNGASQFLSSLPSDIGSTFGGLANFLITPPGYTQGGTASAGGQFPYNYPITQTDINRIISGNPRSGKACRTNTTCSPTSYHFDNCDAEQSSVFIYDGATATNLQRWAGCAAVAFWRCSLWYDHRSR